MLPPLSGYTDLPYRRILAKFYPPFIITEMVKARALVEGNPKTLDRLQKETGEHLKGVRLLGHDPEVLTKAAKIIQAMKFDYVDINMGCTVKKVRAGGEGIALMKDEGLAGEIVSEVSQAIRIPVTVKIRTGFSQHAINVLSFSRKIASCGATAITIHGRSGEKKFSPSIDLELIKKATLSLPVPVIANGGIFSGRDAREILAATGAKAVMPGRGLLGNPWIITDILNTLSEKPFMPPSLSEKKEMALIHFNNICDYYGGKNSVLKMRKILPWYFTGCRQLKNLRRDAQTADSAQDIRILLDRIKTIDQSDIYE